MGGQFRQPGGFRRRVLVAGLGGLLLAAQAVVDHFQVGQDQFQVDGVDVPQGVHVLGLVHVLHHMHDVVVVKAAHHMYQRVAFPDMPQELVAQPRAVGRALDQPGDVHKFHDGGGLFIGLPDLGQLVQPRVGHGDDAGIGLDGAERIVGCLRVAGRGDGVKQSRLAHVGQADDS